MADEYINKTELLFEMATSLIPQSMDITRGYAIAKDLIRNAPVADVAPVVHGKWIPRHDYGYGGFDDFKCSACGVYDTIIRNPKWLGNYCPNCGADMRGGHKDAK